MGLETWLQFTAFWILFVTTPGPNAVNCVTNGQAFGVWRSLPGVAAILVQAILFLSLAASGVAALLIAAPRALLAMQILGAGFLFWTGWRNWRRAGQPMEARTPDARRIFWTGFAIATINPKSVAGYLAGVTQFIDPDVALTTQLLVLFPTALTCTTLSYCGYTWLGARLGRSALSAIADRRLRQALAACLMLYGLLLLTAAALSVT